MIVNIAVLVLALFALSGHCASSCDSITTLDDGEVTILAIFFGGVHFENEAAASFSNMKALKELHMSLNRFTGSLPPLRDRNVALSIMNNAHRTPGDAATENMRRSSIDLLMMSFDSGGTIDTDYKPSRMKEEGDEAAIITTMDDFDVMFWNPDGSAVQQIYDPTVMIGDVEVARDSTAWY